MYKKLIFALIFTIFSFSFSEIKNISEIKSIEMSVSEKSFINNKEEKLYKMKYVIPNLMRKEMVEPKSHKGEVFIYNNGVKIIYLPIFDEIVEDSGEAEENFVIDTVNQLQKKDVSDSSFRKLYNSGKNLTLKIDNIKLELKKMEIVDEFYIPTYIKVFDKDSLVAEINLKDIKINKNIDEKEFDL